MKKWIAIATLLLGGIAAAQSADCPLRVQDAQSYKTTDRFMTVQSAVTNVGSKPVKKIQWEMKFLSDFGDKIGVTTVIDDGGPFFVQPNDKPQSILNHQEVPLLEPGTRYNLTGSLNTYTDVPTAAMKYSMTVDKVMFEDGTIWKNQGQCQTVTAVLPNR